MKSGKPSKNGKEVPNKAQNTQKKHTKLSLNQLPLAL
jgi:hypothetical protein